MFSENWLKTAKEYVIEYDSTSFSFSGKAAKHTLDEIPVIIKREADDYSLNNEFKGYRLKISFIVYSSDDYEQIQNFNGKDVTFYPNGQGGNDSLVCFCTIRRTIMKGNLNVQGYQVLLESKELYNY